MLLRSSIGPWSNHGHLTHHAITVYFFKLFEVTPIRVYVVPKAFADLASPLSNLIHDWTVTVHSSISLACNMYGVANTGTDSPICTLSQILDLVCVGQMAAVPSQEIVHSIIGGEG